MGEGGTRCDRATSRAALARCRRPAGRPRRASVRDDELMGRAIDAGPRSRAVTPRPGRRSVRDRRRRRDRRRGRHRAVPDRTARRGRRARRRGRRGPRRDHLHDARTVRPPREHPAVHRGADRGGRRAGGRRRSTIPTRRSPVAGYARLRERRHRGRHGRGARPAPGTISRRTCTTGAPAARSSPPRSRRASTGASPRPTARRGGSPSAPARGRARAARRLPRRSSSVREPRSPTDPR